MQPRARIELGHQLYAVLEQCRKPEVLWAELATGHYDWLGVRRNGKYVPGAAAAVGRRPGGPRSPAGPGPGPAPCRVPRPPLVLDGRPAAERYVVRSLPRLT